MNRNAAPTACRPVAGLALATVALVGSYVVAGTGSPFEVRQLAEGVHLLAPRDPGLAHTNSLVIEQSGGLLVVEAQPSVDAARELLRAIAELSRKPVRYLVLSHAHTESTGGASAFPDSTIVVARRQARNSMKSPVFRAGAELLAGRAQTEPPKPPPVRMPDIVIQSPAEIDDPKRPVELLTPAHSHTDGDLLVRLPEERILYLGAIAGNLGNPYAADGNIEGWLGTLNHVASMNPAIVVPLRGPAGDLRAVRRLRDAFAWLRGQVELAFVDGVAPGRIADRIIAGGGADAYFDRSAEPSFLHGTIDKIVEEANSNRRKRGIR